MIGGRGGDRRMIMANPIWERHHVKVEGQGARTVVLGHGLGTDQHIWRRLVPSLASQHQVVLFDHAGCGSPSAALPDPERYTGFDAYADDLVALLRSLRRPPVSFVGHSASAAIGLLAAVKAPELFSSLVLLAASPRYLDDGPAYRGGVSPANVESLLKLMDENFVGWSERFATMAVRDEGLQRELASVFKQSERTMLRRFTEAALRSDVRAILPRVSQPCLVLATLNDDFVPPFVATYLATKLPHARLVWLDADGHCPQMSDPQAVASALETYWGSLS